MEAFDTLAMWNVSLFDWSIVISLCISALTRYKPIQFIIMQAITSFTLKIALNTPEIAAQAAEANVAIIMHCHHGKCQLKAHQSETPIPIQY